MILNFTIYAIVVILLFVDRQTIKLTEIIGISNGSYYAIFLFVLYLFLLYIDLKPKIKQAANLKLLKRRTLIFSFWVGIIWGVLISLSGGFHYKIDPFGNGVHAFGLHICGCYLRSIWILISQVFNE